MKRTILFCIVCLLILFFAAGCVTPPPPEEIPEPEVVEEPPAVPAPPPEPELKEIPEIIEPVRETLALVLTSGLFDSEHFGIPRAGSQFAAYDREYPAVLIDRGGSFSGHPFADTDEGKGVLALMNLLPYSGTALGIDDFSHDSFRLSELAEEAAFPFFLSHITGEHKFQTMHVTELEDYTVGMLSVIDSEAFLELHPTLTQNVSIHDPLDALLDACETLEEEGTDFIILFSEIDIHSMEFSEEELEKAETLLDSLTLIIQHTPAELQQVSGSWLYGTDAPLTSVLLQLEDGELTAVETEAYTADAVEPDERLAAEEAQVHDDQQQIIEQAASYVEGGAIDEKDRYGLTPLMDALQNDESPPVIGVLLQKGAQAGTRDDFGMTPLMYSAWLNTDPRVTTRLMREGASLTALDDEGWTPLMRSVLNDNPQVMKRIIAADTDVDKENNEGWTALMFAAGFGYDAENIEILIDAGADVNKQSDEGMTPLMYAAAFNDNPEFIRLLLEAGADPDITDEFGSSALDYARQNRNLRDTEAVDLLEGASS